MCTAARIVPQRVPELEPTPLQSSFIYLSIVVLVCGVIAIGALELGTPMSSLMGQDPRARRRRRAAARSPPMPWSACGARSARGGTSIAVGPSSASSGRPCWPVRSSSWAPSSSSCCWPSPMSRLRRPRRPPPGPRLRRRRTRMALHHRCATARAVAASWSTARWRARTASATTAPSAVTSPTSTRAWW